MSPADLDGQAPPAQLAPTLGCALLAGLPLELDLRLSVSSPVEGSVS